MDIQDFFVSHARLSRKTLARFAETDVREIDSAADDLGFGPLLRLDEAEEVLAELDGEDADDDSADRGDAPEATGDEDDDDDEPEE